MNLHTPPNQYRWPVAVELHREQIRNLIPHVRAARVRGDRQARARLSLRLAYERFWLSDSKTGIFPEAVWNLPELHTDYRDWQVAS